MRIALTGGRSPLALFFAKKMKKLEHELYMLEHISPTFATYCNYFTDVKILPAPAFEAKAFQTELLAYLEMKKIDLLVPFNEETLYYSRLQNEIQQLGVKFLIGEQTLLERLHNKYSFNQWCQEIGLLTPATEKYQNQPIDFERYLVKPEYSRFGQEVFMSALEFNKRSCSRAYIVQEKMAGQQICLTLMIQNGKLVSYGAHDTNLGVESFASLTYIPFKHPELVKIIWRLAAHLGENGIYSFDFFYQDQQFYPIECNPRLTFGAVIQSEVLLAHLLGTDASAELDQWSTTPYGIKLLWFGKMVTQKKWRSTFSHYRQTRDVLKEALTWQTWLMTPIILLSYYVKGRRKKMSLTDFVVHDISYPPPFLKKGAITHE